jgi:AsmA protein
MANRRKILIWVLLGGGVLFVTLLTATHFLLSPERIRQALVPILEQTLAREVTVGKIDIGLFSGITAEPFEVRDRTTGDVQLSAHKAVLKFQIWPLLAKRVVIDRILIESPELTLVRSPDGKFNSFLPGNLAADDQQALSPDDTWADEGTGLELQVAKFTLSNGKLVFFDQKLNPAAPFRYQLNNFNLKADKFSPAGSFPIEVSGDFGNAPFRVQGTLDLGSSAGSFKVTVESLDLAALYPYFKRSLPGIFSRAGLSLALEVAVTGDKVVIKGRLAAQGMYLALNAMKDFPIRDGELALQLDLQADTSRQQLVLRPSEFRYNQIPLQLQGEILHWDQQANLDLEIAVEKLKIRDAIASLPEEMSRPIAGLDPAGTISLHAKIQGKAADPLLGLLQSASLSLDAVQANFGPVRPSLGGSISLANHAVTGSGLHLEASDNRAIIDFTLADISALPLQLTTTLVADRIDLDALLTAELPSAEVAADPQLPAPQEAQLGPFSLPLAGEGTVKVGELIYHNLKTENLDFHGRLHNNLLTIDRLNGQLAGGTFSKTGQVDLGKRGLEYQADVKLDQVQVAPLLESFAPNLKDLLFGNLSLSSSIKGQGTSWPRIKKQLVAKGSAEMTQFQLSNAPVVTDLAGYLQLDELKHLLFDEAKTDFKVKQGRLEVDSVFFSPQISMLPQGFVGLDGELDLALPTAINPGLASKLERNGRMSNLLVNQQGWTELPLKLKGTIDSPEFQFDAKLFRQKAGKKLERLLSEKPVPIEPQGDSANPQ